MTRKSDKEDGGSEDIRRISEKRARWLETINHPRKTEMAFEMEMALKALDRFFNVENLPLAEPDKAIAVSFREEVSIVLAYVNRVINLSRTLMEASRGSVLQFQSYVETALLNDLGRAKIRQASRRQDTPDESIFLLFTGFVNARGIVRALLRNNRLPYPLYVNIGNLIGREIIANRYFNPVREIEFRPEFDRIENRKISRVVTRIKDETLKKRFSIILLVFYRLLKYLDHINPKSNHLRDLRFSIPLFALITSESRQLIEFLERNLPKTLKEVKGGARPQPGLDLEMRASLLKAIDSMGFQLAMELKKVNRNELLGATKTREVAALRSGVENSHGILANFFQQSIIHIVKAFEPHIDGKDIFSFYISRLRQSLQLRNDIWIFKELMERFEEKAETNIEGDTDAIYIRYLNILKEYLTYFRMESYNLLRYDDLKEFDKFFAFVDSTGLRDLKEQDEMHNFIYKSKYFKIYLETTLGNIDNRSELKNRPVDIRACEHFLKAFIKNCMRRMRESYAPFK